MLPNHLILNNLKIDRDNKILDIGSGYGVYIDKFVDHVKLYACADIIKNNISKKKSDKKNNLELYLMSGEYLGFKENTFDIVFLIEVFEHVRDDNKIISEIFRVLKPNGKLVITAPNKLFPFETHGFKIGSRYFGTFGLGFPLLPLLPERLRSKVAVVRVYSSGRIQKMLKNEGFFIIKTNFIGPGLDQFDQNFPKYKDFSKSVRNFFTFLEKSYVKIFLTTIILVAEKR